ncbi:MAG: HAMP domain-containing histidine kinase [Alphaproteobacteria bacterium]|nr:HAMP domain-containing histidine kinase [Alphaproteobacteria bacterium]
MPGGRRVDTPSAMPATPPPLRLATEPSRPLLDDEVRRVATRVVGHRAWFAPLIALLAAVVALADPEPWRVIAMSALATAVVVGAVLTARRARLHDLSPIEIRVNLAVMWVFQLGMIAASGGLDSPLVPILVPLGFVTGMLESDPRRVAAVVAVPVTLVIALAAAQTSGRVAGLTLAPLTAEGAPLRAGTTLWLETCVLVVVMSAGAAIGALVRRAVERVVHHALSARADQLQAWETHSRDLQRLGAEIAHELKNPLASIKGLSTLLARDPAGTRAHERLEVLRAEVDRMQAILEEFLTFSRPLAPLSLGPVDLGALAREVTALHEGVATSRRVQLLASGEAPEVRADARKLQQVLVNLVQNALDASPADGRVEVVVSTEHTDAVVEVRDQGQGLPAALGERVFEAGVTSKPDGSGLGLPVALAIARQHGGRLALLDGPRGGVRARLAVPLAGPPASSP